MQPKNKMVQVIEEILEIGTTVSNQVCTCNTSKEEPKEKNDVSFAELNRRVNSLKISL